MLTRTRHVETFFQHPASPARALTSHLSRTGRHKPRRPESYSQGVQLTPTSFGVAKIIKNASGSLHFTHPAQSDIQHLTCRRANLLGGENIPKQEDMFELRVSGPKIHRPQQCERYQRLGSPNPGVSPTLATCNRRSLGVRDSSALAVWSEVYRTSLWGKSKGRDVIEGGESEDGGEIDMGSNTTILVSQIETLRGATGISHLVAPEECDAGGAKSDVLATQNGTPAATGHHWSAFGQIMEESASSFAPVLGCKLVKFQSEKGVLIIPEQNQLFAILVSLPWQQIWSVHTVVGDYQWSTTARSTSNRYKQLVPNTRIGLLMDKDTLPDDWTH
ncbi:hypothetical protein B0H19DRAFT_1069422 [Mycena capillaripes]|nr:hypothetical protein B0H19DRAFT_1069422 [Mycena capillaripes]